MKAPREWHKAFFKNSFYNPASPAALAKAPSEAAFALRQLKLKKGAALLDLCCGPGRHAVEFAKKGLAVTGFDFSREYLQEAGARAKKKRVSLRLIRGDMRRLKFNGEFDAVVNLFTSFGYFRKFSDDLKTLKGAARALKPGGLFLIDIVHGDFVRKNFRSRSWEELEDHYLLVEDSAARADGMVNTWTRIPKKGGKILKRSFFNRLYNRRSLSAALRKAGLKPLRFWGGFAGQPLSPGRNRLIALAKKPG
jgi:SAM-dependent methyltransferase